MKAAVSLFLLFLSTSLLAQTQAPRIADEIVVTASAIPETVESTPATVTVITKKQIDAQAARDVEEVLREVPGVSIARTGSLGKTTSVFIRGASSKQTLVLWNGIEINDPYFSGYNFGQFSTAGVQRIEVARGPFSSLYGADAVGGVINIITSGAKDHAGLDVAGGGHGLVNGLASFGHTQGRTSFSLVGEHRQDNGFAPNDDDRQNSLLGGVHFSATPTLQLGLIGRAATYDLGVPRTPNDLATAYVPSPRFRENGTEWQVAAPVTANFGAIQTDLRVSDSHRRDHAENPDAQSVSTAVSNRRAAHVSASTSTPVGTIVAGIEGERADAKNHDTFGLDIDTHHRQSDSAFVEDRFSHGPLEISAGLRYDHYDTFGAQTSPRLAAGWAHDGNKVHVAYGESFRAPQIGELYLPFFGNPDLHPERSRSGEIGYDRFFANGGNVSATLFRSTFRDLIFYDLAANRFANIGAARSSGLELAAANRIGAFSAALSYTYLRAVEEPSGAQLPRRPRNSGSLTVGYQRDAALAELVIERVGSRTDVNELVPFANLTNRAFTVADVALHWNAGAFEPYAKIENVTNTRYQEVFGYPSPSRRAIVGIRYSVSR